LFKKAEYADAQQQFELEKKERVANYKKNYEWRDASQSWQLHAFKNKYMYNFSAFGRPIIQYPQDMVAIQELIWQVQPDLIIETGIAHGGSIILSAAMLELNAICGGPTDADVLALDIDIRAHNRIEIEKHPMAKRITMIEGSSIDPAIIDRVHAHAKNKKNVMVFLDSNHTHDHVLAELNAYAPLVSLHSYCVVFDTIVEDLPDGLFPDRPWSRGNNPKTAVWDYLKTHSEFEIDRTILDKLLITVAPDGYLKRIK
jgi:cephalosporin hydroxylase